MSLTWVCICLRTLQTLEPLSLLRFAGLFAICVHAAPNKCSSPGLNPINAAGADRRLWTPPVSAPRGRP